MLINNGDEMDINSEEYKQEVLIKDVVMLAARILLESGAEGTCEDTMTRIAKLGYSESNSFIYKHCHPVYIIRNRFLEYLELPLEIQT